MPIRNHTIVRGPQFKAPYWRPQLRFIEGGEGGNGEGGNGGEGGDGGNGEQDSFTQADVDKLVSKVRSEERRKATETFADYDELKTKADGARTTEERVTDLAGKLAAAEARSLRSDIAAEYGISTKKGPNGEASDAELFLPGTDESTLTKQAKRLADREADRKKNGNIAPREGRSSIPKASDEREAVRTLFGGGQ